MAQFDQDAGTLHPWQREVSQNGINSKPDCTSQPHSVENATMRHITVGIKTGSRFQAICVEEVRSGPYEARGQDHEARGDDV